MLILIFFKRNHNLQRFSHTDFIIIRTKNFKDVRHNLKTNVVSDVISIHP